MTTTVHHKRMENRADLSDFNTEKDGIRSDYRADNRTERVWNRDGACKPGKYITDLTNAKVLFSSMHSLH
jgi:hypothetical protein